MRVIRVEPSQVEAALAELEDLVQFPLLVDSIPGTQSVQPAHQFSTDALFAWLKETGMLPKDAQPIMLQFSHGA
jgi:hypothetical protein